MVAIFLPEKFNDVKSKILTKGSRTMTNKKKRYRVSSVSKIEVLGIVVSVLVSAITAAIVDLALTRLLP